ncbi:MAG: tyrosine-type recombinase/integrase [Limibaculum sp.]
MTGLRFLFRVTLRRLDLAADIYHIREPQKIPLVISTDEAKRLLAMAKSLRVRLLLSLAYGCGLRAGEVVRLRAGDIDSAQSIIRVVQAKGRKDRHVMLSKELLALLRQWWKARPRRHDAKVPAQRRWLFPGRRPGRPMTTRQLSRLFHEAVAAAGITKPVTLRRLDLAAEIYHLREPQKIPLVISTDEAKRLLAVAKTLKVRVLLSLAYGCGLRAGEVVRLRVGDIDTAQHIIRVVQAKGRKDRNVMLSPDLLGLLRQWWKVRPTRYDRGVPPSERWLFPGRRLNRPITTRQLSRLFHEAAAAAGITKPVTLHSYHRQLG